ncbi:MAG TPA: hypothetical protein VGM10_22730 [Actinocrinis sp.]|jgi:hypothetical protein
MLGILVWWAVPIAAVAIATLVAAIGRRLRRGREDMFTTQRYGRALSLLARTQNHGATSGADGAAIGDVRVFPTSEPDEVQHRA